MADLAMCANQKCPSRSHCYRVQAPPSQTWQAMGAFSPRDGADRCEGYIPFEGHRKPVEPQNEFSATDVAGISA